MKRGQPAPAVPLAAGNNSLQVGDVRGPPIAGLLTAGMMNGASCCWSRLQAGGCAEAIGRLPATLQALPFGAGSKRGRIESTELSRSRLCSRVLLERLRSAKCWRWWEEMSPDDRVAACSTAAAKGGAPAVDCSSASGRAGAVHRQFWVLRPRRQAGLMTTEFISTSRNSTARPGPRHCSAPGTRNRDRLQPLCH